MADGPITSTAPRESGLSVRGATVRYGGVVAVSAVDLDVAPGEIVGLIGPNGAGKTSFIDGVLGFTPRSGTVVINGHDVSRSRPHRIARRGLGRTWQSPDLFGDLTVGENIDVAHHPDRPVRTLFGDVFRRHRPISVPEGILDDFELVGRLDDLPSTLSLGQQKLLGVARGLISNPSVLLLDEPAAGLDSDESQHLGRHLRALAERGLGMLLVDHDMDLVFGICDRVVVLQFGRVIATGTPAEVRSSPAVIEAYLGTADPAASPKSGGRP
jgi:ABC-type branched-subunit amino acid transport system ATPase component